MIYALDGTTQRREYKHKEPHNRHNRLNIQLSFIRVFTLNKNDKEVARDVVLLSFTQRWKPALISTTKKTNSLNPIPE